MDNYYNSDTNRKAVKLDFKLVSFVLLLVILPAALLVVRNQVYKRGKAAGNAVLKFAPVNVSPVNGRWVFSPGVPAAVDLLVDNPGINTGIEGVEAIVHYNPDVIRIDSIKCAFPSPLAYEWHQNTADPGVLNISCLDIEKPSTGWTGAVPTPQAVIPGNTTNNKFATIHFTPLSTAAGQSFTYELITTGTDLERLQRNDSNVIVRDPAKNPEDYDILGSAETLSFDVAAGPNAATFIFNPSSGTFPINTPLNVKVVLNTGLKPDGLTPNPVSAIRVKINYDSTQLHAQTVTPSGLFFDYNGNIDDGTGNFTYISEVNGAGTIDFSAMIQTKDPAEPVAGQGREVATISFMPLTSGTAALTYNFISQEDRTDCNILEYNIENPDTELLAEAPAGASYTFSTVLVTPTTTPVPTATNTPVPTATPIPITQIVRLPDDFDTKGEWHTNYGADYYILMAYNNGSSDVESSLPSYIQSRTLEGIKYSWGATGTDLPKVLDPISGSEYNTARYSAASMSFFYQLNDEDFHNLAIYFYDPDRLGDLTGRYGRVEIIDPANQQILDTRNVTDLYNNPLYLRYSVKGSVIVKVTNTRNTLGANMVIQGIFFGGAYPLPTITPTAGPSPTGPQPTPTVTPVPTQTPTPVATSTPIPTATNTPTPISTSTPIPTATPTVSQNMNLTVKFTMQGRTWTNAPQSRTTTLKIVNPATQAVVKTLTGISQKDPALTNTAVLNFTDVALTAGTYEIYLKPESYLQKMFPTSVTLNAGNNAPIAYQTQFLGGDFYNDVAQNPGDTYNTINSADYNKLIDSWRTSDTSVDIDGRGVVDEVDFNIMMVNWLKFDEWPH